MDNKIHAIAQWGPMWQEGGRRIGYEVDLHSTNLMENVMKEAGFVNIVTKDYKVNSPLPTASVSSEDSNHGIIAGPSLPMVQGQEDERTWSVPICRYGPGP